MTIGEAPTPRPDIGGLRETALVAAQSPIAVVRDGVIAHGNPALFGLLGTPGGIVGTGVETVFAPAADGPLPTHLDAPGTWTGRVRAPDGEERSVSVQVVPLLGGAPSAAILVIQDPDAGEGELPGGRELYRAFFDLNTAVKLLIDPATGRIRDANGAAAEFYGWPVETLRQMRIQDINLAPDEHVADALREARDGENGFYRFRHRTAARGVRDVEVHTGPVQAGTSALLLSIIHDVTERERLERELRRTQRLDAVGRLAGGVAHEYNNALTAVFGHAELLAELVDERGSPHVQGILEVAQRARELTRQLLAFSQRQALSLEAVVVDQLLGELAPLLHAAVGPDIELRLSLHAPGATIRADIAELQGTVVRLVLRARQVTPAGGCVRLETWVDHASRVGAPGPMVGIRVVDQGAPLSPEQVSALFEPFGPGSEELTLPAAYGVVQQSHGRLAARALDNGGLAIEARFPAWSPPVEAAPQSPAAIPGSRVLVVDDDVSVRRVLRLVLERRGFAVTAVGSADEAWRALATGPDRFDIVLSDVVMPGRSGVDLAWAARDLRPNLPILLISGDVGDHDPAGLPDGVGWLQKPFLTQALIDRVGSLLGRDAGPGSR